MSQRTEREFQLALAKLLDRVRVMNSWSERSFQEASRHIINISKSEALRFYKALVELNALKRDTNRRKMIPNFDVSIWRNEDKKLAFVRGILECYPDIVQKKGRVPGKKYTRVAKEVVSTEIAIVEETVEVNPLEDFTAISLVEELRRRGYTVTATRQVIVQEEL